jgi:hypothetical protein
LAPIYDQRDVTRSKLALGIYEKKNLVVENSLLMKLYEFEFYIDPSMADALFEQTLAYVDGSFIVI